jgi:hypothetical protein
VPLTGRESGRSQRIIASPSRANPAKVGLPPIVAYEYRARVYPDAVAQLRAAEQEHGRPRRAQDYKPLPGEPADAPGTPARDSRDPEIRSAALRDRAHFIAAGPPHPGTPAHIEPGCCWCGCGEVTGVSQITHSGRQVYKGVHNRYLIGHSAAGSQAAVVQKPVTEPVTEPDTPAARAQERCGRCGYRLAVCQGRCRKGTT